MNVTPLGPGRLQGAIGATGTNNWIQSLAFGTGTGVLLDLPNGATDVPGPYTLTVAPGTVQVYFVIRQATAGAAATIPLVVTDRCQQWPTFVGGGAPAFAGPAAASEAATAPTSAPAQMSVPVVLVTATSTATQAAVAQVAPHSVPTAIATLSLAVQSAQPVSSATVVSAPAPAPSAQLVPWQQWWWLWPWGPGWWPWGWGR